MKKITYRLVAPVLSLATFIALGASTNASAQNQSVIQDGAEAARGSGQPTELFGDTGVITTITNTLLFVVGALAVVMIIVGGIRYAISGGNASSVTAAKNTVLYAVVGLIIAFLAFAAVNWVLSVLVPGTDAGFSDV